MSFTRPTKLPRWADSGGIIVEPTEGKKDIGWLGQEKPPAEIQNWWQNDAYNYLGYLDQIKSLLIFGDGSDGNAVLDGIATFSWATLVGSTYTLLHDVYLNNLTVNVGATLKTAGSRICIAGTLTVNGTIQNNGNNASGPTAGLGLVGTLGGGGGGGGGNIAGAGNPGFGVVAAVGGAGGASGGAGANLGAAGGTATAPTALQGAGSALTTLNLWAKTKGAIFGAGSVGGVYQGVNFMLNGGGGGAGGAGSGTGTGGGGGAGGGVVLINAQTILISATGVVSARGGDAGTATGSGGNPGGGGGGGGGGLILLNYSYLTNSGAVNPSGGTHSAGVFSGADGSDGIIGNTILTTI